MDFLIPLVEELKETEQELFEFNEKEKERIYNLFKKNKHFEGSCELLSLNFFWCWQAIDGLQLFKISVQN